jgi:hypothetical protein
MRSNEVYNYLPTVFYPSAYTVNHTCTHTEDSKTVTTGIKLHNQNLFLLRV